jgi:hypothetical protein
VVVEDANSGAQVLLRVLTAIPNDDQDVALLEVDGPPFDPTDAGGDDAGGDDAGDDDAGDAADGIAGDAAIGASIWGIEPIAPWSPADPPVAPGALLEIAGNGVSASGASGQLHFAVESAVTVDAVSVTMSNAGISGACSGDSGGPVLARAADGSVRVVGALSLGSGSCTGTDTYVRLDSVYDWVRATVGSAPPSIDDCGGITAEGRCFGTVAAWCESSRIAGSSCGSGTECGWSASASGYRCVPSGSDPCEGVDSVGGCREGSALVCGAGVVSRTDCAPCGQCRIDAQTGGPACQP